MELMHQTGKLECGISKCFQSVDSANRERKIVGLTGSEPSSEKYLIEQWLASTEK
jgi:hypothetical protein